MLTKTLTSEAVDEIKAVGIEASVARYAPRPRFAALASFWAIVAQFGLIVMVVDYWQLESQLLTRLLWLAFGGFIIHHWLPVRFRLSLGHRLIADKLYEPLVRLLFASPTKQQASRFQKP